jgi:hypothetical protein
VPGTASRTREALPGRHLTHGMNTYTLLDDAVRGFGGGPAGGWDGEDGRRRQVVGERHVGGERRHLFGVGEGPAEALAEVKQKSRKRRISGTYESG